MLKKNDLVKQFELVVKQEIIEHNNSILANNLAMNSIKMEMANLSKEIKDNFNLLKAGISQNKSSTLELFELIESCSKNTADLSSYMKIKLAKTEDDIRKDINQLAKEFVNEESFSKYKDICKEKFDSFSKTIEDSLSFFLNKIKGLEERFNQSFELYQKEVSKVPITLEKFNQDLMYKIEEQRVEKLGVAKEIKVLKKAVFINEKKIENLYTLIERINNK